MINGELIVDNFAGGGGQLTFAIQKIGGYMGKQIKKASQKRQKVSKFQRICERCGNEVFSPKRVFRCRYCGWMNGILERNNE